MSQAATNWREIWRGGLRIKEGAAFSFVLPRGTSFVSFRGHDGLVFLRITREGDALAFTAQDKDKAWSRLSDKVAVASRDLISFTVEATPEGTRIAATHAEREVTVPVDLTGTERVNGAGLVYDFAYAPADRALVAQATAKIIRAGADLTNLSGPAGRQDDLIFDFGMHNGDDTAFYLAKGFRVVAVDANPQFADLAAERFAQEVISGKLTIVNLGVASEASELTFYVSQVNSEQSSFDGAMARRLGAVTPIKVDTVPPQMLWQAFGAPYYAKIDIEGFDWIVVKSAAELDTPPAFVSFETSQTGWTDRVDMLARNGFDKFKVVDQMLVPEIVLPNPSREGDYVDHVFRYGASGPFGQETPGRWTDAKGLPKAFEACQARNSKNDGWYDVHAARD